MIILFNEPYLRQVSTPVTDLTTVPGIVEKLKQEAIKHPTAAGLCGVQIGTAKRIFIRKTKVEGFNCWEVIVNPTITKQDAVIITPGEGCLSFPGKYITTSRYARIELVDQDHPQGRLFTGREALTIQHEVDHLDGVLFIDREYKVQHVNRNAPCPCNSGKKYKKCCGK